MKPESITLKNMKERLSKISIERALLDDKRALFDDEEQGIRQAIGALEKQLGISRNLTIKKPTKKKTGRKEKREKVITAIVDFLQKNGDCKNKDVQEHLEALGLYKANATGNQSKLSRLLSDETANENSLIKKEDGGFVSLRK